MQNKCSGCGATLAADEKICPYCETVQEDNSDQALLDRLMSIKRHYEIAQNQGDQIIVRELLANDFSYTLVDGDEPETSDRNQIIESSGVNARSFFSYSYSQEKLLERSADAAKISCIDTTCRHYPKGNLLYPNGEALYYERAQVNFVCRAGRWQIASINATSIDEDGNNC
ncbi:MAG: hypothetical protein ACR2HG_10335 [Pyrinomonadaceae bacterium]